MIKPNKISIFLAVFILLILLFLLGPRVKVNNNIKNIALPENLDDYLNITERSMLNITPDTEKKIFWYNKNKSKTEYSIIYIHGFSATRQETVPLCDTIASNIKANLFYTRLTAHGQTPEEFANVTVNDWLNDADEAIEIGKRIGNKVILIGMSAGSILVMWLADRNPDVSATILLSPVFKLADKNADLLLLPWGNVIARLIVGKYKEFTPKNNLHSKYWTSKYRVEGLIQLIALVNYSQKNIDVKKVAIPSLFLYSENDEVIDINYLKDVYNNYGAKQKKIINIPEAKDHMITGDICSPLTTKKTTDIIIEFLNKIQ